MRARGSLAGPLILIGIGVLFLVHTFAPNFQIGDLLANYWPYLLIVLGAAQLLEVLLRVARDAPINVSGVNASSWILVLFICFVGLANWEIRRPNNWWRRAGFEQSVEVFGDAHNYSFSPIERSVGKSPHIVLESFRGNAKIVGSSTALLNVSGRKTIRALNATESDRANTQSPVVVRVEGDRIVIQCNQDAADGHTQVTTDLDLSVPLGASIEATGRIGDFDVSKISGDVDLTNENGELHLQDIRGDVKLQTHKSDLVRCTNVRGTITVRGRGSDVQLTNISGTVNLDGDYNGTVTLRAVDGSARVKSMRTQFETQRVPGEVTLARGSLEVHNFVGPTKISARSTDVTLDGFTQALELSVDKGDVELHPGQLPLSRIAATTKSGNIVLSLPTKANFALSASTKSGDIENQFGDALTERTRGHSSSLQGSVGDGPQIRVVTERGSITVRKTDVAQESTKASRMAKLEGPHLSRILHRNDALVPAARNASL